MEIMAFIVLYASQVQQLYQSDCAAFMIALFYCTCRKSEKEILENGSDRYFFRVVDYTMLQTKFRQTKYKIILKSYSVWHIICWVYLLSAQATSIQHLRRDIPNEKQRLRLFSSQKWLNNIKKFECKSVLLLLWFWFFFRFASSLVHSFHSLIIVSFGSDLNLRIMFVIWAITVDKKNHHIRTVITQFDYNVVLGAWYLRKMGNIQNHMAKMSVI